MRDFIIFPNLEIIELNYFSFQFLEKLNAFVTVSINTVFHHLSSDTKSKTLLRI